MTPQDTLNISAINAGAWGNKINLVISDGSADPNNEFDLAVELEGELEETHRNLSISHTATNFVEKVITMNSKLLRAELLPNTSDVAGVSRSGPSPATTLPVEHRNFLININQDGFQEIELEDPVTTGEEIAAEIQTAVRALQRLRNSTDPKAFSDFMCEYMDFNLRDIPIKQGKISSQVFTVMLPKQVESEDNEGEEHYKVEFRLPNGGDQEEFASLAVHNEAEAVNKLLARCIQRIDGITEIDESHIEKLSLSAQRKIEETMAELAPQVDLEMEAKCPECEKVFSSPFNMPQFFLDEMKVNLNQLYQEVHFLAFYYKWSESDILSMTRKKRRKYLQLLSEHLERIKKEQTSLQ